MAESVRIVKILRVQQVHDDATRIMAAPQPSSKVSGSLHIIKTEYIVIIALSIHFMQSIHR